MCSIQRGMGRGCPVSATARVSAGMRARALLVGMSTGSPPPPRPALYFMRSEACPTSTKAHTEALVDTDMHAQRAHLDFTNEELLHLLTGILSMVQVLEVVGGVLAWSPHQVENSECNLVQDRCGRAILGAREQAYHIEGGGRRGGRVPCGGWLCWDLISPQEPPATRMVIQELRDVVHLVVQDDPSVGFRVVLFHVFPGEARVVGSVFHHPCELHRLGIYIQGSGWASPVRHSGLGWSQAAWGRP
jgi:hypothetical protein